MEHYEEIIWEDSKQKPGVLIYFILFIPALIFIIGFIISFGKLESLGWLFLSLIFILTFSLGFRIKYTSINNEGLWSGNNTSGQMLVKLFILKQRDTFIEWNEIDKLEIDKLEIYFS